MFDILMRLAQLPNLLLLPLLARQGREVRRTMPRLPEADGESGAVPGNGPTVRVLLLGDSLAAGVGADHNKDALAGQLATALSARIGRSVFWRVVARTGATARYARGRLAARLADLPDAEHPDVIVVVVGMNDLLQYRTLRGWRRDVNELLSDLANRASTEVLVCGMPPFGHFRALPQPLRNVFGRRAKVMDRMLEKAAAAIGAEYTQIPGDHIYSHGESFFSRDLFHPSVYGYRQLAEVLAPAAVRLVATERERR